MSYDKRKRARKIWFTIYIGFLSLLAISFVMMHFYNEKIGKYSGIIFWIGLIGTVGSAVGLCRNVPKERGLTIYERVKNLAVWKFFKNPKATIADTVMISSLIAVIVMQLLKDTSIVSLILVAFFVFSFGMHCVLNGNIYKNL